MEIAEKDRVHELITGAKHAAEKISIDHAAIEHAKRIKNWPMLDKAIDALIEDQAALVAAWDEMVRPHGGDRKSDQVCTDANLISFDELRKLLGIDNSTISRWRKGLEDREAYRKRLRGRAYAAGLGLDRKTAKKWSDEAALARAMAGDLTLICGDISEVEIPKGSIDLVVTDPPYPQEFLPLYEVLARRSADWLRPGGSLLCMCGESWLPEIIGMMGRHMRYHWTLAQPRLAMPRHALESGRIPITFFHKTDPDSRTKRALFRLKPLYRFRPLSHPHCRVG